MQPDLDRELMAAAIERDGDAQRALLAGDVDAARAAFRSAAELYRESWEAAAPKSYGRLVGMLKSAVLAGGGSEQADYALAALGVGASPGPDAPPPSGAPPAAQSPTAAYVHALATLILLDGDEAQAWASLMRGGSAAFDRAADAIDAIAAGDQAAYAAAQAAIVRDFEQRADHLTGVAIADTAVMLELLAERRGLTIRMRSPVLPNPESAG
jgi:hypothetical protein